MLTATPRRTPLVAGHEHIESGATADLAPAAQAATAQAPVTPVKSARKPPRRRVGAQRRRSAASVGWWGLSLIVASLGVVVLIGTTTFEHLGRRDVAIPVLTVGLQRPTERLLVQELARDDAGPRVTARADLVAFDIDRATALADPSSAARAAAEQRAEELYDKNPPADPGVTRTELGISRSVVGVMSEQNHREVAKSRVAAAVLALALLAWCLVQTRDDNMLVLPSCALAGGWLLATAAKRLVIQLISDVNGASDTYVRAVEAAAAQPLALAKTAAMGMFVGAVLYRFATIARHHLARRAERRRAARSSVPSLAQPTAS